MPTPTATVRSTRTVRENAVKKTRASLLGHLVRRLNWCHSPMFQATKTRTALRVASGMLFARGAATRTIRSKTAA